jgi:hypothetical protein
MSHQPESEQPLGEAPTYLAPAPNSNTRKRLLISAGIVAAVLALIGGTAAVTLALAGNSAGSSSADQAQNPPAGIAEPAPDDITLDEEPTTAPTTSDPTPSASDIKLSPKITDKQCFGSAGCSVTVKVEMAYSGPDLAADDTFEVTYELTGAEDGPVIGTFEVTGDQYTVDDVSVSTKSSRTKILIKATDVDKVGL